MMPSSGPLFQFFERVRIRITPRTVEAGTAGKQGAILGISDGTEEDVPHSYAVQLDSMDKVRQFQEDELETMGTFDEESRYDSGHHLRIDQKGRVIRDE